MRRRGLESDDALRPLFLMCQKTIRKHILFLSHFDESWFPNYFAEWNCKSPRPIQKFSNDAPRRVNILVAEIFLNGSRAYYVFGKPESNPLKWDSSIMRVLMQTLFDDTKKIAGHFDHNFTNCSGSYYFRMRSKHGRAQCSQSNWKHWWWLSLNERPGRW